jgi:hypothetical protein
MRNPEQAREARARRKAQREGLALQKSRTRNPGILDWGTYMPPARRGERDREGACTSM